jgi:hypothetical protein
MRPKLVIISKAWPNVNAYLVADWEIEYVLGKLVMSVALMNPSCTLHQAWGAGHILDLIQISWLGWGNELQTNTFSVDGFKMSMYGAYVQKRGVALRAVAPPRIGHQRVAAQAIADLAIIQI